MIVSTRTTYTFSFTPNELGAVTGALETTAEHSVLTETATEVATVLGLLNTGEPLTWQQADDLRVWVVRYCKATSGTDEMPAWPGLIGEIARRLQQGI
jgi:hypothetical protein